VTIRSNCKTPGEFDEKMEKRAKGVALKIKNGFVYWIESCSFSLSTGLQTCSFYLKFQLMGYISVIGQPEPPILLLIYWH